jgi:hypothetical protein
VQWRKGTNYGIIGLRESIKSDDSESRRSGVDKDTQKRMAEKLLEASEDKINRNIKDSVFCDLFGKPEYLIQLYRALLDGYRFSNSRSTIEVGWRRNATIFA